MERFFDKSVALCNSELVNEHSDRKQWAIQMTGCLVDPWVSLYKFCLVRHSWRLTNEIVTILLEILVLPC